MSGRGADTPAPWLGRLRWPLVISAVAALLTLSWVAAAVAMSSRGFDITDEGYYVLSYRWWSSNPRNFTGVQYLYGPLFQALGYSVAGLRIVRLVSVVAVHAVFAWSFVRWLRVRRPEALTAPGASWAVGLTLIASGGITYGWLPLSPGYNDVAMLGSLTMAAIVLCTVTAAAEGRRLPVLPALSFGPALVAMVLAKWASAGLVVVFLAVLAVAALRPWRPRGWLRYVGVVAGGTVASLLLVDLLVKPFSSILPPMLEVTRHVAASANSPSALLPMYARTTFHLLLAALVIVVLAAPVLMIGGVLARTSERGHLALALAAVAPIVALVISFPSRLGLPGSGALALPRYSAALLAMALLVAGVAAYGHRPGRPRMHDGVPRSGGRTDGGRRPDAAVVVLLLLLPPMQAMGSGNPLYYLAVNQIACWVALMVLVVLAPHPVGWPRGLAAGATGCAVVVAAVTGTAGLLIHPYRTAGFTHATTTIGGTGPLAALTVSPTEADLFRGIRNAAGPGAAGRPVFAFDELAGLVLDLNGTSVGEPWYSAHDQSRTEAGIRSACAHGAPRDSAQALALFNRPVDQPDRRALASCHLSIGSLIAKVPLSGATATLNVYRTTNAKPKEKP